MGNANTRSQSRASMTPRRKPPSVRAIVEFDHGRSHQAHRLVVLNPDPVIDDDAIAVLLQYVGVEELQRSEPGVAADAGRGPLRSGRVSGEVGQFWPSSGIEKRGGMSGARCDTVTGAFRHGQLTDSIGERRVPRNRTWRRDPRGRSDARLVVLSLERPLQGGVVSVVAQVRIPPRTKPRCGGPGRRSPTPRGTHC